MSNHSLIDVDLRSNLAPESITVVITVLWKHTKRSGNKWRVGQEQGGVMNWILPYYLSYIVITR